MLYLEEQIGAKARKRKHWPRGTGKNYENSVPTAEDPHNGNTKSARPEHTSAPNAYHNNRQHRAQFRHRHSNLLHKYAERTNGSLFTVGQSRVTSSHINTVKSPEGNHL